MILVPSALTLRLSAIEAAASSWLDEHTLATELQALVPDIAALNTDERRGCIAEILCHRFAPNTPADRRPWDSYFGPTSSGIDADGNEAYMPDANEIDVEVITYWKSRAAQTPHPILRARYADLAWEIGHIRNRANPDQPRIERPRELAQGATGAYLESVALAAPAEPMQLYIAWRYLGRALELAISVKDATLIECAKKAAFDFNRANRAVGHTGQWWLIDDMLFDRKGVTLTDAERQEIANWLQEALDACSDLSDRERFDPHQALQAADRIARWAVKTKQAYPGVAELQQAGAAFEAFAKQTNAMTAIAWLEYLSVRYRDAKLPEAATRVDAEIITRSEEAKQSMRLTSVPISVTEEDMERWLGALLGDAPKTPLAASRFT